MQEDIDKSIYDRQLNIDGIPLEHPLTHEMIALLEKSKGKRSESWLTEANRFCPNAETNLLGAFLFQEIVSEYIENNPEAAQLFPEGAKNSIVVTHDKPLYIYNKITNAREPFLIDGKQQTARTAILKQNVGATAGIITEGSLAGLVVEPSPQKRDISAETVQSLTISRLTVLPTNADMVYEHDFYADQLQTDNLMHPDANFDELSRIISAAQRFVGLTAFHKLEEQFQDLHIQKDNFVDILEQFCEKYSIPFDRSAFNYLKP